jgi:hypothetical protein
MVFPGVSELLDEGEDMDEERGDKASTLARLEGSRMPGRTLSSAGDLAAEGSFGSGLPYSESDAIKHQNLSARSAGRRGS